MAGDTTLLVEQAFQACVVTAITIRSRLQPTALRPSGWSHRTKAGLASPGSLHLRQALRAGGIRTSTFSAGLKAVSLIHNKPTLPSPQQSRTGARCPSCALG